MIRYPISKTDLERLIDVENPTWRTRAAQKTEAFRTAGSYLAGSDFWSDIKSVFITFQGTGKCIFCERKLESDKYGKIEHDVEHFRPKGNIKGWKLPKSLANQGITVSEPPGSGGYHLLAYNPLNYATSCKTCNSILKKDCFPVSGSHIPSLEDPANGTQEKPLLIYPVSEIDDDPADLIEFEGIIPKPKASRGHKRNRALVTIEFFKLHKEGGRTNLLKDRALVIGFIFPILEANDPSDLQKINRNLPHFNCIQSFIRLYQADRPRAKKIYEAAKELVLSTS